MSCNSSKARPSACIRTAALLAAAVLTLVAQALQAQQTPQSQATLTSSVADAQTGAATDSPGSPESAASRQEVIVTGTRQQGLEAVQSAAPIQIVGAAQLQQTAAIPNLMNT